MKRGSWETLEGLVVVVVMKKCREEEADLLEEHRASRISQVQSVTERDTKLSVRDNS